MASRRSVQTGTGLRRSATISASRTGDPRTDEAIKRTEAAANPILGLPILQGNRLTNISIKAGENIIRHSLGGRLQGWWVTRVRGAAPQLFEKSSANGYLTLQSDTSATIDLWVF